MRVYKIQSTQSKATVFEGEYTSISACLEDAVNQKIDLQYANLRHQNLSNANLDDARMTHSDFTGANLTGTNLSEARLLGANFTNAILYNTCLAYSDMQHCTFAHTAFGATDISGCNIGFPYFSGQSCFSLNFHSAQSMRACRFANNNGKIMQSSAPPIVISGIKPTPIILINENFSQLKKTHVA